jgi:hypothetical protein
LRHIDQTDIAGQLGVDQSTISRDLAALKQEWRVAVAGEIAERIALELAELDQMERDCALQYSSERTVEWINMRLAIKKRRADLLGLDAPKRTELTGREGGPWEPGFTLRFSRDDEDLQLEHRNGYALGSG